MRRNNITDEYLTMSSILNAGWKAGDWFYIELYKLAIQCYNHQKSFYHEVCYWGFEVLYE